MNFLREQWTLLTDPDERSRLVDEAMAWFKRHPILMGAVIASTSLSLLRSWNQRIRSNTVLKINLSALEYTEHDVTPFHAHMQPELHSFRHVLELIHQATDDPRVRGLVLLHSINVGNLGLARMRELRQAVLAFGRVENKVSVAFSQNLFNGMNALSDYWLLSACSRVFVHENAMVNLVGLGVSAAFLRGTLDKMGVTPLLHTRRKYKNAANTFTESEFTPEHKEATQHLVDGLQAIMLEDIAASRPGIEAQNWLEQGPYLADDAIQAGLIDGQLPLDEMMEKELPALLNLASSKQVYFLTLDTFAKRTRPRYARGKHAIALVVAEGVIHAGKGEKPSPFGSKASIGSRTTVRALQAARKDKSVSAVVLRVDSPGGDAIASDVIAREIELLREAGKPVVISMGNVAASGGYYISAKANRILVESSTITGSIGVVFGKMLTREGMQKHLGITFDTVQTSDNAMVWSPFHDFDDHGLGYMNRAMDSIYDRFKAIVASGRGLSPEEVEAIAQGRVWLGSDAVSNGLADEVGGLRDALVAAKRLILAKDEKTAVADDVVLDDKDVRVQTYPKPQSFLAQVFGSQSNEDEEGTEPVHSLFHGYTIPLMGLPLRAMAAFVRDARAYERAAHVSGLVNRDMVQHLQSVPTTPTGSLETRSTQAQMMSKVV